MFFKKIGQLVGCVALSLSAGFIGSLATRPNIDSWYAFLDKPPFLPPNWVFAPVWTTLYILMGIALFLTVITSADTKRRAYRLFGLQLILNAVWSLVFFGAHQPWLALGVILALLTALTALYRELRRIRRPAVYLSWPYIAWVCFATYLNMGVAILN